MARPAAQDFLAPATEAPQDAPQILTFRLGRGVFGIEVRHVREVLDATPITPVANAPASLLGMVDVRHEGIPVIDLARRLRMGGEGSPQEPGGGPDTRIVVLEIDTGAAVQVVAIVADAVLEVVDLDPATLERPPRCGEDWDAGFIRGIGRRGPEFMTLLQIEALFGPRDAVPAAP